MIRYSRQTIDDAILVCAIQASNKDCTDTCSFEVAKMIGLPEDRAQEAAELAATTWLHVNSRAMGLPDSWSPVIDAEAEAMLQTGWLPPQGTQ